jgi:hypothetical protein
LTIAQEVRASSLRSSAPGGHQVAPMKHALACIMLTSHRWARAGRGWSAGG